MLSGDFKNWQIPIIQSMAVQSVELKRKRKKKVCSSKFLQRIKLSNDLIKDYGQRQGNRQQIQESN